jgi:hypothetical protein
MDADPKDWRETVPMGLWMPPGVGLTVDDYSCSGDAEERARWGDAPLWRIVAVQERVESPVYVQWRSCEWGGNVYSWIESVA